jgi:hypothetical protein
MKRITHAVAACSLALGCSGLQTDETESVGSIDEALNGTLSQRGNLTRKTFAETSEALRQLDTYNPDSAVNSYYETVRIGSNGTGASISDGVNGISTLNRFKTVYGFTASDPKAFYYNRGDLGIGREMHCADRLQVAGQEQIACYVSNFAAGPDNTEFTFGLSANIAFDNMNKPTPNSFATVAMVFRKNASTNKVFFVVYDQNGNLSPFAALDRHGLNYALAFKNGTPGPEFGVPGETFNNHIPSNCIACHGGDNYVRSTHVQNNSLFLPFDLDQFEYQNAPNRTRAQQTPAFKTLNEIVRKVAALSVAAAPGPQMGVAIKKQLDGWYGNMPANLGDLPTSADNTERFEGEFNPDFVPAIKDPQVPDSQGGGRWNASATSIAAYRDVVRRSCRGCHVSSTISFNTEKQFRDFAFSAATDLCSYQMPHALQTLREFWQSGAPAALESYYRNVGQIDAANKLHACSPGTVATLDPDKIGAAAAPL